MRHRNAPHVWIELARTGQTKRIPVTNKLVRFEYTETRDKTDEIRLTFADEATWNLIEHPWMVDDGKSSFYIKFGYAGNMSETRKGYIREIMPRYPQTGHVTLDVICHDPGAALKTKVGVRVWYRKQGYTAAEIVKEIAKRNGFAVSDATVEPTLGRKLRWEQGALSDMAYMEKLAKTAKPANKTKKGTYKVKVVGDSLHFRPLTEDNPPVESLEWRGVSGDLYSFEPQSNRNKLQKNSTGATGTGTSTSKTTTVKKAPAASTATTSYTVKAGDTLSELAAKYKVSVSAIAKANGISNVNMLRVGKKLKIPKSSTKAPPRK